MSTFVFAGGGTGGHIAPGLAVAERLVARGHRVVFVTSGREIESRFFGADGGGAFALPIEREGERRLRTLRLFVRWPGIVRRARRLVREVRPDVVIGTGGRVTWFALRAAHREGIPTALIEVNAEPGRAVRWLESRVDLVLCGFPRTLERLRHPARARCSGVPIRADFVAGPRPAGPPRLLVLGGSQGSRFLNDVVIHLMRDVATGDFLVDHLCGDRDHARCQSVRAACPDDVRSRWSLDAFAHDLPLRLRACDVVLGRAGASTVAEVQAMERPAVFVPYPHHEDEHQAWNARALGEGMILHRDADGLERVAATVADVLADGSRRERMAMVVRSTRGAGAAAEHCVAELLGLVRDPRPIQA